MVVFDNEVRQLKTELHEEKLTTANQTKKIEELEEETRRLSKELDSEKEAREEAWDKVSILKLEINATMQDLDFERRRLKGAKERLMLWEIQLHAFYSTTEEMQVLFAKQQEQLKAMQRTLENEENYENTSVDMDGVIGGTPGRERRHNRDQVKTSSNEASVTEKHDCEVRSQECQNTQEFTSADHDHDVRGGFSSDIDGAGTTAMMDGGTGGTEDPITKLDRMRKMTPLLKKIREFRIARSSSHQIAHGNTTMFILQDIDCIHTKAIAKDPQHFRQIVVFLSGVDMDVQKWNIERDVFINQSKAKQTKT
ncbi:hypothetical protein AHAS_Ahas16G0083600 [Arachis hypogaea]